jgi:RimJ/RimL family protein N-acetyltransferase
MMPPDLQERETRSLGPPVDATPALSPGPAVLSGRFGQVEKLAPFHASALWQTMKGHDDLWTYLGYGPFCDFDEFSAWIDKRASLADPYSYVIVNERNQAVGIAALMEIRPDMRAIEIGNIVYSPAVQRTPLATEAQYLIARYVFQDLRYRRYEWKCNALNAASRRAALRFGFVFEGLFRQHIIVKGRNRDTAWYSMLDYEWPARRQAFERWLGRDNFTADGRQRRSLSDLIGPST